MGRDPAPPARADGMSDDRGTTELFRLAFEEAPDAIVVAQDGRLKLANRAAERLTGRSRAALVGCPFTELVHPEDLERVGARYQERLAGDHADRYITFRILDASGAVRWIQGFSRPTLWEKRPAVVSFLTEVTERERERQAAADLERLLSRIAQLAPYFIFVYDYDLGRDLYINRPVPQALGYSDEEAVALGLYPFEKLCHPEDFDRAIERDQRWVDVPEGAIDVVEFRMLNRAGEWRWFRSLNTPFQRDASGRVRQMLGVCLDITELKRSEEALHRSEKLESLGLLAGGLAHDFGNLLTPILGHAELLERKLPADSPAQSNLRSIRTAAERASELVHHLLVVSGRGAFEPVPVALDALILEVAAMQEAVLPEEVHLRVEIAPQLPEVAGDPTQLRQVLLNLVGNAIDALAERGGTIIVRALPVDVDDTQASVLELRERVASGPAVLLEVEDDGPGMDAATRARLLEPFFTTKPKGRGLGLASVVGIIRRHRGGLAVDSNPGRGTIFRILLPLARNAALAPSAAT